MCSFWGRGLLHEVRGANDAVKGDEVTCRAQLRGTEAQFATVYNCSSAGATGKRSQASSDILSKCLSCTNS